MNQTVDFTLKTIIDYFNFSFDFIKCSLYFFDYNFIKNIIAIVIQIYSNPRRIAIIIHCNFFIIRFNINYLKVSNHINFANFN